MNVLDRGRDLQFFYSAFINIRSSSSIKRLTRRLRALDRRSLRLTVAQVFKSWRTFMKLRNARICLTLGFCLFGIVTSQALAQLAPNQTNGFGNGRMVKFTYLQNYDCVTEPAMDLDFNKKLAQSDPNELQTPICQAVTEPTTDPA